MRNHTIRREQRQQRIEAVEQRQQRIAAGHIAHNQNNTDPEIGLRGTLSIQDQEDRRLLILTSIVHKVSISCKHHDQIQMPKSSLFMFLSF